MSWSILSNEREGMLQCFTSRPTTPQTRDATGGHLLARAVLTDSQRHLRQQQLATGNVSRSR